MSNNVLPDPLPVKFGDSPSLDSFARLRVSFPDTLFDSKQIHDSSPLFWDDQETSGSGTSTTFNTNGASTTIAVSNLTAGTRVRQTFQRMNYQSGKSHLILFTWYGMDTATGITKRAGYFDSKNGLFYQSSAGTLSAVIRSYVTGSAVDTAYVQSSWNIDKLDGTGESGITLDLTNDQIGLIDFEWLGVGRVRFGFVIDGMIYYCHEVNHANKTTKVYMSTPNQPVRYEISNDGTGAADDFTHICSSVMSEGGEKLTGMLRHADSGSISSLATGTRYAALGMRLKSTHLDVSVLVENISAIATTGNDKCHWELILNPTVAGTFTYSDETSSAVQIATGSASNTVTGGYALDGGYFESGLPVANVTPNALRIGAAIDDTPDEIVLVVKPITNNITVEASMTRRELS